MLTLSRSFSNGRVARGVSVTGSHRTERESLPSPRTSHLIGLGSVTQAQWADIAGCLSSSPSHHRLARLCDLSRLNFRVLFQDIEDGVSRAIEDSWARRFGDVKSPAGHHRRHRGEA